MKSGQVRVPPGTVRTPGGLRSEVLTGARLRSSRNLVRPLYGVLTENSDAPLVGRTRLKQMNAAPTMGSANFRRTSIKIRKFLGASVIIGSTAGAAS